MDIAEFGAMIIGGILVVIFWLVVVALCGITLAFLVAVFGALVSAFFHMVY